MGQSTPIRTNDQAEAADALSWARIAGLVDIRPDGSWQLTPDGLAGMLKLLGQEHPFDTRPLERIRRQQRHLV